MKIEIDDETIDGIVRAALNESSIFLRDEIKKFRKKKRLEDYEKEDLADCILNLDAITKTYEYFGGNSQ